MKIKKEIKKGTKFGSMKVIKEVDSKIRDKRHGYRRFFLMECICGNKKIVNMEQLTRGKTISCGCVKRNFLINYNTGKNRSKENSPRWISDRTTLKKYEEKQGTAYADWRRNVYERDNWKCKIFNGDCVGRIEAHHILNWIDYPELRYEVNNGITLCHYHHPLKREEEAKMVPCLKELIN